MADVDLDDIVDGSIDKMAYRRRYSRRKYRTKRRVTMFNCGDDTPSMFDAKDKRISRAMWG